jgi:uncharacterized protein YciI
VLNAQEQKPSFDKALADSLGADDYGMRYYILAVLKTGSYTPADSAETSRIFRGHFDNMARLAEQGKLIVAGPLAKNDQNYRGIYIFNASSIEEGRELVKTDPAVKAGVFDIELYRWYGSAALPVYLKVHEKIARKNP